MPTISDVVDLVQAFGGRSILTADARCVAVRNRNAQCQRCADVCKWKAFTIKNNEVKVDLAECVSCGACVAVCPTEAVQSIDPLSEDLAVAVANAAIAAGNSMCVIACARKASHDEGDPDKYATVPCLGRIEELMIIELAARGIEDIVLVDGDCSTCKYGVVNDAVDNTVESAITLLEAVGAQAIVSRASEFPPEVSTQDERKLLGASRRNFLTDTSGMAKDMAMLAAEQVVAQKFNPNQEKKVATLREKLGVGKMGSLPHFEATRNVRMLDALYEAGGLAESGEPAEVEIDTRVFGNVSVDTEACKGCGMCVMFCPTSALKVSEEPHEDPDMRYLDFSAADCVQCGLCADACMGKAITVSSRVNVADLFDFEPRLIEVKKPAKKQQLFGRRR